MVSACALGTGFVPTFMLHVSNGGVCHGSVTPSGATVVRLGASRLGIGNNLVSNGSFGGGNNLRRGTNGVALLCRTGRSSGSTRCWYHLDIVPLEKGPCLFPFGSRYSQHTSVSPFLSVPSGGASRSCCRRAGTVLEEAALGDALK